MRALGAYIFAGGFTLGVRRHFDVLAHFEESSYGVKTTQTNMPDLPIFVGPDKWPVDDPQYSELDFLYGNPPCAAWSPAGFTKTRGKDKWKTDPRVDCTRRHFELLEKLRPKVWAWESVTQAFSKGRPFVDELTEKALAIGYSVTYLLHDAQWLGVPQRRPRFFMVCHRVAFTPQAPNWAPPPTPMEVLADADRGEPLARDGFIFMQQFPPEVLAKVRPGERLADFWERELADPDPAKWKRKANGDVLGRPSYGHRRYTVDGPGTAVIGYNIIHPTEPRFLSTEEMQVLSSFPKGYVFTDKSASKRAAEIARGVCPRVGEWLASQVKASLTREVAVAAPVITLADFKRPPKDMTVVQVSQLERPIYLGGVPPAAGSPVPSARPRQPTRAELVPARREPETPRAEAETARGSGLKMGRIRAKPGIGRMAFLQSLIMMNRFTAMEMVAIVRDNWAESKCSPSDVSTQRIELRKMGHNPPKAIRSKA